MKNDILLHNNIYKDIFTKEEIESIYNVIDLNQTENTTIVSIYAQKAWFVDLPQKIKNKMNMIARDIYKQNVNLEEISFARYSKEYGELPNLTPHYDNVFLEQRVTIDVQLKSNIEWPIVVSNKEFTLKDNEALTFSGTHQVHWRKHRDFNDKDFIEMLFCHFSLENKVPITMQDKIEIEKKMTEFTNRFSINLMKDLSYYKNLVKRISYE